MRWLAISCALASLTACATTAPLPPEAVELNRAGSTALAAGDLEIADARLSLALEYSPRFVEALVNLGLVELQRGNFERARRLLERARRLNPDVAQPHHALGVLAEREARRDRASEHYREALRVDPGFAAARANLGRLWFEAGDLEAARIAFQRLVEVAPELAEGHLGLAETLVRLGRYAEAARATGVARTRFPDHPAVRVLEARAVLRGGNPDEAVRLLSPLAESRDDLASTALAWLATAELARGRPRHAVGAAQRALALDPAQPVAVRALAAALTALGDPAAKAWTERAADYRAR